MSSFILALSALRRHTYQKEPSPLPIAAGSCAGHPAEVRALALVELGRGDNPRVEATLLRSPLFAQSDNHFLLPSLCRLACTNLFEQACVRISFSAVSLSLPLLSSHPFASDPCPSLLIGTSSLRVEPAELGSLLLLLALLSISLLDLSVNGQRKLLQGFELLGPGPTATGTGWSAIGTAGWCPVNPRRRVRHAFPLWARLVNCAVFGLVPPQSGPHAKDGSTTCR